MMNFKKMIVSVAAVSLMGSIAHAGSNIYVGAGTGVNVNTANEQSARHIPLNVFAGVGATANQSFYVGAEANATLTDLGLKDRGIQSSYSYGASVLPGVMIGKNSLIYGRAGLVKTRFPDDHATRLGTNFGGGLQTSLAQNIDVRAEYDFLNYDDFANHKNPRSDQAHMDLIYKFE